jgi:Xaa-Pro aminopeptidase
VHEGRTASPRWPTRRPAAGMIVSNEPGYYKTGAYGIRIENLVR